MTVLKVTDLSLQFLSSSTPVVRHISFSINKGELLALVGESGSGKSVSALAIMQLHPPHAVHYPTGSICFANEELMGAPEPYMQMLRGKRIGMVFQEPMTALNPLHTIGRQIAEVIRQHHTLPEKDILARVHELLEMVGLESFTHRLNAFPHQLSGGERQRVVIAMAIANNPDLLIADEPTTALDVTLATQIIDLMKDLQKRLGLAVLLITHDLHLVRRVADSVAIMQRGEIVEQGETHTIFSHPQHPYTRHLIASVPKGVPRPVAENSELMLASEDLKVWFPAKKSFWGTPVQWKKAVDGASIELRRGQSLGIVGESGSGKTTLGLALLRLIKSKGSIRFAGNRLDALGFASLRPFRKRMQFIFQDPFSSLNPRMTIEDIVGEGLRVHFPTLSREERAERVASMLAEVGLEAEMMSRYPHEFSGGQRQRIAIARALILQPELIVLDEPTSALDVSLQVQIVELLRQLQEKHGVSYLFISHDLRVVRALCHRICVIKDGVIIERGAAEDIFEHPRHDYTKALIEAAFAA